MKKSFLISIISFAFACLNAQEKPQDPMSLVDSFTSYDFGLSTFRVNTKYNRFGDYNLNKGEFRYSIQSAIMFNFNRLYESERFNLHFKSGLIFSPMYTNLTDSANQSLQYSEFFYGLPLMLGTRFPVRYNRSDAYFFKAVDFNVGIVIGLSTMQSLYPKGDLDLGYTYLMGDYMKMSLVWELIFSAVNNEGYGHRMGVRSMLDIPNMLKLKKEAQFGIYPVYMSLGIFYTIFTDK
jgi:hypothetical protein